jgi:hypothetical protein
MKKKLLLLMVAFVVAPVAVYAITGDSDQPVTQNTNSTKQSGNDVSSLKDKIQALRSERMSQREEKRAEIVADAKKIAASHLEHMVTRFEAIKKRLLNMKVVSAEDKESISLKIDTEIDKLNSYKTEIEAAKTAAEVRAVMVKVRLQAKSSLGIVKGIVAAIHEEHLLDVADRITKIATKIKTEIDTLAAAGKDTNSLSANYNKALGLITQSRELASSGDYKGARAKLVESRLALIEVLNDIKTLGATADKEGGLE